MEEIPMATTSENNILKGTFNGGFIRGLEYQTQTIAGMTDERGEFEYRRGETITFSIGGLALGSAPASESLTPADIVLEVAGDLKRLKNPKVTNMSRFLMSLDKNGDVQTGITITDEIRSIIRHYRYDIIFNMPEGHFEENDTIKALFSDLGSTLRSPAQARNHLRRSLYSIKKHIDIKIPTRDDSYLLADIYRPLKSGRYPTIVNFGAYGKGFFMGPICSEADVLAKEAMEDSYFEGNPNNIPVENHETLNTVDWVPDGYVIVRVDSRGSGKTPGKFKQFSLQEAMDFYDSIEWAAKQKWSNGNVGTWGISYWAMTQWNMAQLQPPSLKAMVPIMGSNDSFRGYIFNGGLYNRFNRVVKNTCGEWDGVEWIDIAKANPFYDPELYGPIGSLCITPDLSKIKAPLWSVMPQLHPGIHIRDSSEGYIRAGSKHKKLTIIGGQMYAWPYSKDAIAEFKQFFEYWLKGIDNGAMDGPPVNIMVRTGWGNYSWQQENEWPIARTRYVRYYLDATPSGWEGDGRRDDFMRLSQNRPEKETKATYSAGVNLGEIPKDRPRGPFAPKRVGGDPGWSHGVSFITEPLAEDTLIAGYLKLGLWASANATDMDIVASFRVMDENNHEIVYGLENNYARYVPVTMGWLKVSHRKTDPEKSTEYRPWHTHTKANYQPLTPDEVVEVEVEIWPTTAMIKKGCRIRLDIQPTDGYDHPTTHDYDESYHTGASNTIYTGPDHPSYLQIPIIP